MIIVKLYRTQGELTAWCVYCEPCVFTMRMRVIRRKNGRPYVWPSKGGRARSLKCVGFRESATNILTFVVRWGRDGVFRKNRSSRGEMSLNGRTHRQDNYSLAESHLLGRAEGLVCCLYATCSSGMLGYVITNRKSVTLRKTRINAGVLNAFQLRLCGMVSACFIQVIYHFSIGTQQLLPVETHKRAWCLSYQGWIEHTPTFSSWCWLLSLRMCLIFGLYQACVASE